MVRSATALAGAVLGFLLLTGSAGANAEARSGYSKGQTYNAALRYLRIDLSYEVTEKDPEAAYLLFKFLPDGRKTLSTGSIQIVELRDGVRVTVRLPEQPRYHEQLMSDGLMQKLRDEYGEPPRREDPPKDPKEPRDPRDKKASDRPDGGS
jgi:hypothetical protein